MSFDNGKQARYYNKIEDSKVHCFLCPHNCVIKPHMTGACRARKNIDGDLFSLNYGKVTSLSLDPIEKKPLNRFHPGTKILSAGSFGCNLKCSFCQNWTIAHEDADTVEITPQILVDKAVSLKNNGNIGIAYTYNEPSIWYEFVYDTCQLAKKEGLSNVLVTNGFISREPLSDILPLIDAMNIDVKAFTSGFYKDICSATLDNVKESVELASKHCHVEVTTLVIPDLNDSIDEIEELSKWLSSISRDIPLHLSRFFPNYKMSHINPTPKDTLISVKNVADNYLNYVYLGNV
ncbi:AmmeMemoRadiSam system radical SAM enzyme [Pseudobacteroides cellulosolvens]|uniref:Radical SAM domain protein n=1 Tax=Pseudobacteroides cellulosolvens ATCC 35603 = DSM 2933 TaxID=398512 RepID=A0A0L6JR63_9FIRM|nr:AmmeMemoRadiSam system radical SAM enzyme [Pseudobacteroides cellulosolvens]KNY28274.1 Radical SAM domain protein [Pseudobacteroides cellulosolvens ATCC 35603 = DSM 2933]